MQPPTRRITESRQPDLVVILTVDNDDDIVRPHAGPLPRDFALDGQEREQVLAAVGVDVLPVQRVSAAEAVGQQDRHIFDWWA